MNTGAIILIVVLSIFTIVEILSLVKTIQKNKLKKQELEQNKKSENDSICVPTDITAEFYVGNSDKEVNSNDEWNGDSQ